MTLTINLGTRGRPQLLLETIERTLPNISRDDTVLMVSADKDDEPTIAALANLPHDRHLLPVVLDREDSVGEKMNRALVFAPADVYMWMVDYAPIVTPGFDQRIIEAALIYPDRICGIYSHWANLSFPTLNAATAQLVEKMGFFYPPHFPVSWWSDHWFDDIVRYIDRIAFADVRVDISRRPGTQGLRDVVLWATLFDALYLERQECARKIIKGLADPPWRKELLLSRFPWVHQRSQMVNAATRASAGGAPGVSMSAAEAERYQRIKAKAEHLLRDLLPRIEAAEAGE